VAFGVYVHIPFCAQRCDYCDFATWTDRAHLVEAYVHACVADAGRRYARDDHPPATSVFFGGGTPSLLDADLLLRILDAVPRTDEAEVTVECNPDSVDASKLAAYRRGGVTRLSFGVQSMVPHVLRALGRTHDPANVTRAVAAAREAGFGTFNLDLIYGAAGEAFDDWRRTLDLALALEPPHVSCYALTVEAGTRLAVRVASGETASPDDDDQARKYEVADDTLAAAGLGWYEISNWARPGHECRHNLLYWSGGDYLGIGCAAHGSVDGSRWWTVRTPERYMAALRNGRDPAAGSEVLEPSAAAGERLMLALRTRTGAEVPPAARVVGDDAAAAGLATWSGGRLVLTRQGRLLASDLTVNMLAALEAPPGD